MHNLSIRIALIKNNVRQWEVARELNMSESVFSTLIREELPEERQAEIVRVIEQIAAKRSGKEEAEGVHNGN